MHAATPLAGGPLAGAKVLLVEDTDDSREMLAEFMRMFGIQVIEARSGQEGIEKFRASPPSLVVSDLSMPDGDGYSLVRAVRELPAEQGGLVPTIAVSAAHDTDEALLAGFNVSLQKPIDPVQLLDVMRNFLEPAPRDRPARAAWSVHAARPATVVITYTGHLTAHDSEAAIEALVLHLQRGPVRVITDLRALTGFDPAATNRGQRAAWNLRKRILSLVLVGGPRVARVVTVAAARLMGIPCELADEMPRL